VEFARKVDTSKQENTEQIEVKAPFSPLPPVNENDQSE
jgi:hypothetical protein